MNTCQDAQAAVAVLEMSDGAGRAAAWVSPND